MFNVIFPPGCYGTFLVSSIYELTNLSPLDTELSSVDSYGSSHAFRNNIQSRNTIKFGHLVDFADIDSIETDNTVVILPSHQRWLDYIDNQFTKQSNHNLEMFLKGLLGPVDLSNVIGNFENFDNLTTVDRWVLRECISCWITDVMNAAFGTDTVEKYTTIGAKVVIYADNIHDNYGDVIEKIAQEFNLVTKSVELVSQKYTNFKAAQQFHTMQEKCDNWLADFLKGKNTSFPGLTIFDEAYVQVRLRDKLKIKGFDIKWFGVNQWPDSVKLRQLLEYTVT